MPGLRKEELAQLAHVSVDYVVRLEQGRTRRVSRPILDALADALDLAPDERAYLFTFADVTLTAPRQPGLPRVAPQLRQLLDTMHDVPAMVLHRGMDVLAWNRAAAALLTDFGALPPAERNLIRLTFLDPDFRALYADWTRAARECVAVLRMETGRTPHDPALTALVGELGLRDPDFRTWWAEHQVRGPRQLTKTYVHPVVGELTLDVPAVLHRDPPLPVARRLHRAARLALPRSTRLPPAVVRRGSRRGKDSGTCGGMRSLACRDPLKEQA
ncbi:helix-turn-helix transcriptional regulator [Streptomyces sp. NPDC018352]|uniref:helix-turn-helix transcriptional regulator n=1 Tax=Streptomyces sp. NPDC018352 TaxID=3157194 RepID=UPI0033F9A011